MAEGKREKSKKYPGVYWRTDSETGERTYYIRYRLGGRGSKEIEEPATPKAGMTESKAAKLRALKMEGKVDPNTVKRAAEQAAKQAEAARMTISKLWSEYKVARPIKGIVTDESRFEKFLKPAFGNKVPAEIDQLSVVRLRVKLLKTHAPQTVRNVLELLRRIINFGVNANLCEPLPFRVEFPRVNNLVTEDLTPDQLEKLLAAIEADTHPVAGPMMLCALFSGMRRGEMFRLKWQDLDFERGFIRLRDPKGGTDQTIPMNGRARGLFEVLPRTSDFVFPGRDGGQRSCIKKPVNKIKAAAGIDKDFRALHGLRHVYASMLASSGQVDMYALQRLMTHKSSSMTARYAHLRDEALQKAGQVVDDIFANLGKDKSKVVNLQGGEK
jgi:integrase